MIKNNKKKILILSPHTDDAELGAGGTIIKLIEEGCEIKWLVFSSAEESVPEGFSKNSLKNEFENVAKALKIHEDKYSVYDFKVRYLHEKRQEVLQILYDERTTFDPDLVIGPSQNDMHQDHQVVSNEMIRAFKNTSSILAYELPWNHFNFNCQFFVTLNEAIINKKIKILNNYKTQITLNRAYFSSDNIIGLAKVRGSQSNSEYAEAFELIKWID